MKSQTENYGRLKKLIVTADDLGLTRRVNDAIEKAHREGIVTSASLMVNGAAFESAIEILKRNPALDCGLHLNLTEGQPVSAHERIGSLANSGGFLYHHPFELMLALFRQRVRLSDLEREIRAQIEKTFTASVRMSHIDGHKHVHVVPQIFHLVCSIASGHGINAIRSTVEGTTKLYSLLARNFGSSSQLLTQYLFGKALSGSFLFVKTRQKKQTMNMPRRFYGITQTGFLDFRTFADIVESLQNGVSELMCHPGYVDQDLMRTPTRLLSQREGELGLFTGREVRHLLEHAGITLATYRDLVDCGNHT